MIIRIMHIATDTKIKNMMIHITRKLRTVECLITEEAIHLTKTFAKIEQKRGKLAGQTDLISLLSQRSYQSQKQ